MALISVLRQQAVELENGGLERERVRPSSPEPAAQLVSRRVLERYLRCARSPAGEQGAPQRDSQVREVRMRRGRTLAYLTEKSSSLLPRHLNERKTSDGESASRKGREGEQSGSRTAISKSLRGVAGHFYPERVILRSGLFLLELFFFNIYILI